jgi:hypothetical protein
MRLCAGRRGEGGKQKHLVSVQANGKDSTDHGRGNMETGGKNEKRWEGMAE